MSTRDGVAVAVAGEAIESEFEVKANADTSRMRASVIDGEASESDDDNTTFNLKPLSLETSPKHSNGVGNAAVYHPDDLTLLQSKLVETNLSLYNNLNKFVESTYQTANKELHASDKLLQSAQRHLHNASKTIKGANESSAQLQDKVNSLLTSDFLSNVKITK